MQPEFEERSFGVVPVWKDVDGRVLFLLIQHHSGHWAFPKGHAHIGETDIEAALRRELQPSSLEVVDDSHRHAGHAGARDGGHFTVRIASQRFAGLARVARHRLVYDALRPLMPGGIHALAIEARAPGEG